MLAVGRCLALGGFVVELLPLVSDSFPAWLSPGGFVVVAVGIVIVEAAS